MAEGLFRHRGVRIVVDTTETAELDIALHSVSEAMLSSIHRSLSTLVVSEKDRSVGPVRIREIAGYDVVFLTAREAGNIVVTIGAIQPPSEDEPLEEVLKKIGIVAMFRGATGV